MKNYIQVIKDRENVYKVGTGPNYLHEDAALDIFNNMFGYIEIEEIPTIELAKRGCITIKSSECYLVIALPDKFNEDQKKYINRVKNYLKENIDSLAIQSIRYENDNCFIDEFDCNDLINNFDELIEYKSHNNKDNKMLRK